MNHLKIVSHTTWHNPATAAELSLAYQHNLREELTEPVSHGYMPRPASSLERRFSKSTYTASLGLRHTIGWHELRCGLQGEHQHNRRGGWGFIIPDFETLSLGGFVTDRYTLTANLVLNAGVRYDYAQTHIHSYRDWFLTHSGSADLPSW